MARRRLLGDTAWGELLGPPADERALVRHHTLTEEDLDLVRARRTDATRLGFALLLVYLRHPGRVLAAGEVPPAPVLAFVARQLGVPRASFAAYGRRDATRRAHLAELVRRFGYRGFSRAAFADLVARLTPAAAVDPRPGPLVATALAALRRDRILLPSAAVIEHAVHRARSRAERLSRDAIAGDLTEAQRAALDALLGRRAGEPLTWLAWLRGAPQSPAPRNVLALVERVRHLRAIGLDRRLAAAVPVGVFARLADEGMHVTPQHLAGFVPRHRHAVLAAAALRLEEALTDAALSMFDKLMGSFARGAERRAEERVLRSARAMEGHLRALAAAGRAVIAARTDGADPFAAIEGRVGWSRFVRLVGAAEAMSGPDVPDGRAELLERYPAIRTFAPALLDAFRFEGARGAAGLLRAIEIIREGWRIGRRGVPADAPTGFVRRAWRPLVLHGGAIDRRAYEICVLSELRDRLRAGDVWVEGSRQYQPFDAALLPRPTFERLRAEGAVPLGVKLAFADHIADRRGDLGQSLAAVAAMTEAGTLPDARLAEGELRVSPLRATTPPEADALKASAGDLLPRVRITDLLLEVDAWTGFSECFTHARSGRPADDRAALLAAMLADGINLGLKRMAETSRGMTLRRLAWVHDWHVREECYAAALARLIEAHRAHPLAQLWGDGTTSSSDGQYFRAGGGGAALGEINARHGNEPGVAFYTHISDQFGPFHTKVIAATASEAPHVLDGLLRHGTGLRIAEHYTDTGGATDHVFGLCALLGFRFAPRLRDLKDRRLYLLPRMAAPPVLAPLVGGTADADHIALHWDELLRLATSIHAGTVSASTVLKRLAAYPRQNGLAVALREVGRIERTVFTLDWIRDLNLRRRAQAGLNKGEARNALARALFFNRLGEVRDRRFENQVYRASGLNLLVAAVILWNTRYLAEAFASLEARGRPIAADLKRHVAPLGWEHIGLTGDYVWNEAAQPAPGQLRPLRRRTSMLAA